MSRIPTTSEISGILDREIEEHNATKSALRSALAERDALCATHQERLSVATACPMCAWLEANTNKALIAAEQQRDAAQAELASLRQQVAEMRERAEAFDWWTEHYWVAFFTNFGEVQCRDMRAGNPDTGTILGTGKTKI